MSTSLNTQKSRFPLTPPSQSQSGTSPETKMAFQLPQTPQSPSQPTIATARASPTDSGCQSINTLLPTPAGSITGSAPVSAAADGEVLLQDMSQSEESNKRKRDIRDSGSRQAKKAHVEDRTLGIEDLHLDVGEKYLLCRTLHPKMLPDLSHDLFNLYSLNEVAGKVARVLPNGEKNGLRKTYKGKIKDLGISGKFDVSVHDEEEGSLFAMMRVPEEEWTVQHCRGNEIEKGFNASVKANMAKAMTMIKGVIPKTAWDSSVLGELDLPEKKAQAVATSSKVGTPISGQSTRGPTSAAGTPRSSQNDIARPKRKIKQRSYGDTSFEGYGEGYVDDDMVDAGYSTGEGDERGMSQKRRKKNVSAHNNYPGPMRQSSYGPGMVGA